MSIAVVTAISAFKNKLVQQDFPNAHYFAFSDVPHLMEEGNTSWELFELYDKFKSPRRNSRVPKILIHKFVYYDYSIWIDGNMKLLQNPQVLVDKYLKDYDIAIFKHPNRDCLYEEAKICAVAKLDDPEEIIAQVKQYEEDGFAKHKGLYEGGFIIRRHTPKVELFNDIWFAEYSDGCVRDQIALPVAIEKAGIRVNVIDEPYKHENGIITRGGIIQLFDHLTPRQEKS